jgi:hypothetical protein
MQAPSKRNDGVDDVTDETPRVPVCDPQEMNRSPNRLAQRSDDGGNIF